MEFRLHKEGEKGNHLDIFVQDHVFLNPNVQKKQKCKKKKRNCEVLFDIRSLPVLNFREIKL